jgi:hypothetical protein
MVDLWVFNFYKRCYYFKQKLEILKFGYKLAVEVTLFATINIEFTF